MESTERKTPTPEEQDISTPETPAELDPATWEPAGSETPVGGTQAETPPVLREEVTETPVTPSPSIFAPVSPPTSTPSEPGFLQRQRARSQAWVEANPTRAWITLGIIVLLLASVLMKFIVEVPQPHVSLAGQPILENGPAWFTNSLLTTFIVDIILIVLAVAATRKMDLIPSGFQNFMEMVLEFIYSLAESIAGKNAATYFPWAATLFLFILISNYSGLIPFVGSWGVYHATEAEHARLAEGQLAMANGQLLLQEGSAAEGEAAEEEGTEHAAAAEAEHHEELVPLFRAPTADLSTTFALSLATMFMVQYHGARVLGSRYFRKFAFWNPTGQGYMKAINGFVIFLEVISELSRILTFAFRLFGNIFAGEVVLAVISFLIAFLVPLPFYALEVMVGAIQALVFTMLALIFFSMATISHEHGDEHH